MNKTYYNTGTYIFSIPFEGLYYKENGTNVVLTLVSCSATYHSYTIALQYACTYGMHAEGRDCMCCKKRSYFMRLLMKDMCILNTLLCLIEQCN